MPFGLTTFTLIHVVLSLVGIFAGLVVAGGLVAGSRLDGWTGLWRRVYVVGAVVALYLNVFVLLNQLFRRMPPLLVAAPTQKEPPFLATQLLVLALFVWLGRAPVKGFRAEPAALPG